MIGRIDSAFIRQVSCLGSRPGGPGPLAASWSASELAGAERQRSGRGARKVASL